MPAPIAKRFSLHQSDTVKILELLGGAALLIGYLCYFNHEIKARKLEAVKLRQEISDMKSKTNLSIAA